LQNWTIERIEWVSLHTFALWGHNRPSVKIGRATSYRFPFCCRYRLQEKDFSSQSDDDGTAIR